MKILLGVTGGIAAYKAAELTRELQRRGHDVQVVLTSSAQRFVTPLTFAALSNRQVLTDLWQPATPEATTEAPQPFDIEHIAEAIAPDALLIAPATANFLARLAHGLADDLLSTLALASTAPLFLAPAMNVNMWNHPATQANLATLRQRGAHIIAPDAGPLACGMVGAGRLAEISTIADALTVNHDLAGETILITAGGTREPIDPVRFLGNRSSGKMGHALAAVALARGARVILITAAAPPPLPCEILSVQTAAEMQSAVLAALPRATAVIMAAAVSDYRVLHPAPHKRKKSPTLSLELVQNEDILAHIVAQRRPGTLVIGFAAETENLLPEARRKLREKHLDAIVANDVSQSGSGFDADANAGIFLTPTSQIELPLTTKLEMAACILDQFPALRVEKLVPTP